MVAKHVTTHCTLYFYSVAAATQVFSKADGLAHRPNVRASPDQGRNNVAHQADSVLRHDAAFVQPWRVLDNAPLLHDRQCMHTLAKFDAEQQTNLPDHGILLRPLHKHDIITAHTLKFIDACF